MIPNDLKKPNNPSNDTNKIDLINNILPTEIIQKIFKYLKPQDLISATTVNTAWKTISVDVACRKNHLLLKKILEFLKENMDVSKIHGLSKLSTNEIQESHSMMKVISYRNKLEEEIIKELIENLEEKELDDLIIIAKNKNKKKTIFRFFG